MTTTVKAEPASTARRGGRAAYVVIGLVVAAAAGGWAVIMANAGQTPGISAQTITYTVMSDSAVQIQYSVAKAKGDTVRCTVDAFDTRFNVVAETQITVPPGTKKLTRTDTLRTSKRANGARVTECRKT
ncbi:DUF4307 domain-containing protein [Spirillospora sp. CA-294931]|uniref:DUF4307 domain-containing protein n=1 Tax=Spirillospora sp. CA-294931 TaxID=3240042 RepID=UPI003D8FEB77